MRKGAECGYSDKAEPKASGEEAEASGVDGAHSGFYFGKEGEGDSSAASGNEHVEGARDRVSATGSRTIDGEDDADASKKEGEPLVAIGPGGFLEKGGEENPPVAAGDNEECAESGAGDGNRLIKEDVLDEGLGEGEGDNEWRGSCFDFCLKVLTNEEKGSAGDAKADAGKEQGDWEGAIES